MYTYVFAFYLKRNNHCDIFEDNQKDLENATEQLSEYLEREITSEVLVDIKQKVQDKSRYCENRRAVLLSHCHEGYEKEFWEYQQPDIIGLWKAIDSIDDEPSASRRTHNTTEKKRH